MNKYRVAIIKEIYANTEGHAGVVAEAFLRGKGVVAPEHYQRIEVEKI